MKTKQQKRLDAIKYMTTVKNYSLKAVAKRFNMPYSTVWNIHDKLRKTYKPVNTSDTTHPAIPSEKKKSTSLPLDRALRLVSEGNTARRPLTLEDIQRLNKELSKEISDGSTAPYYELPKDAKELQDLISHKDMNAQIGEIFRACYRYGEVAHSKRLRDAKKIKFYAEAEIKRLEGETDANA